MALVDTAPQALAQEPPTDWRPRLALGLAALSAVSYVLVLVVPYYAAGQWSCPPVLYPVMVLLAVWALGMAPFACAGVAAWSAHRLWTTRRVPGGPAVVRAALLVSLATVTWFVVQGAELLVWAIE